MKLHNEILNLLSHPFAKANTKLRLLILNREVSIHQLLNVYTYFCEILLNVRPLNIKTLTHIQHVNTPCKCEYTFETTHDTWSFFFLQMRAIQLTIIMMITVKFSYFHNFDLMLISTRASCEKMFPFGLSTGW